MRLECYFARSLSGLFLIGMYPEQWHISIHIIAYFTQHFNTDCVIDWIPFAGTTRP